MLPTLCDVCYDVLPGLGLDLQPVPGHHPWAKPLTPFRLMNATSGNPHAPPDCASPSIINGNYRHLLTPSSPQRPEPMTASPMPWQYRNYTDLGYHGQCFSAHTGGQNPRVSSSYWPAMGKDRSWTKEESPSPEWLLGNAKFPTDLPLSRSVTNVSSSFVHYRNTLSPNVRPNGSKIMEGDLPYFRYLYDMGLLFGGEDDFNDSTTIMMGDSTLSKEDHDRNRLMWVDELKKWTDVDAGRGPNRFVSFVNTAQLQDRKPAHYVKKTMPLDKSKHDDAADLLCRRYLGHFGLLEEYNKQLLQQQRKEVNTHLGRQLRRDMMIQLASDDQKKAVAASLSLDKRHDMKSVSFSLEPQMAEDRQSKKSSDTATATTNTDASKMRKFPDSNKTERHTSSMQMVTKSPEKKADTVTPHVSITPDPGDLMSPTPPIPTMPIMSSSSSPKKPVKIRKTRKAESGGGEKRISHRLPQAKPEQGDGDEKPSMESASDDSNSLVEGLEELENHLTPPMEDNEDLTTAELKVRPRPPVQKKERVQKRRTLIQYPVGAAAPPTFLSRKKAPWLEQKSPEIPLEAVVPELPPLPDLPPTPPPPQFIPPPAQPEVKPKKPTRDRSIPLPKIPEKFKNRWGDKKFDRSYTDWLERQRIAEERRKKMLDWMEQAKKKVPLAPEPMPEGGIPRFSHYGFLSEYCILNRINLPNFRHTFDVVDEEGKGWLTYDQIQRGLKVLNPSLTDPERKYIQRVMELCEYDVTKGADYKLFAVLAALSEKITSVDNWLRAIISQTADYPNLEVKLVMCRHLWNISVDEDSNAIPVEDLCVELSAGGVSENHVEEVFAQLGCLGSFDLIDFLAYVPLFILLHQSIVKNPFDRSQSI